MNAVVVDDFMKCALPLWLQAAAVLPGYSWEVLPSVQCHEDGPFPTRPPLGVRQAQRQWPRPR